MLGRAESIVEREAGAPDAAADRAVVSRMLARVGVDERFIRQTNGAAYVGVPPGAEAHLRPDHPYLLELINAYAALTHEGIHHSRWTREYVRREIPLLAFRSDCGFVWQHRDFNLPVNYFLTYQYIAADPARATLLAAMPEDEAFGACTTTFDGHVLTRDRLDSVLEVDFLRRYECLQDGARILDIGSGYGRLACRIAQATAGRVKVRCVDAVPESTFICEYYVRFRRCQESVAVIPLHEIDGRGAVGDVSVAINVHSFSECAEAAVRWWLGRLSGAHVRQLMVVPNPRHDRGVSLSSTEADGTRRDLGPAIADAGYRLVVREPKYAVSELQRYGVTPTHFHLFELAG